MPTAHIHIGGIVQGVGFRPFVFQAAQNLALTGWVCNTSNGVHCRVSGSQASIHAMYSTLVESPPPLSVVISHSIEALEEQFFEQFEIIESSSYTKNEVSNLILTPDAALCDDCRAELHDPANRRYRYPFITCTQCGPRYSIITALPYDRPQTTMSGFMMCADCEAEYTDYHGSTNRRHYSQTNSCGVCGVTMELTRPLHADDGSFCDDEFVSSNTEEILRKAVQYLRAGNLVAVKGVGGFLLLGDATNAATVSALRERKERKTKPFAVMYPSVEMLEADVFVSSAERAALTSRAAPIVLLRVRPEVALGAAPSGIMVADIAPNLQHIGAMLPYAPLYELIARDFGKPLIATSNNVSGSPIVYENARALDLNGDIADFTIVHNRDICLPQDDSVVRFVAGEAFGQVIAGTTRQPYRIVLRRARGFAPAFIQPSLRVANALPEGSSILAFGADLKNTFAVLELGNIHISQCLGDLGNYDVQVMHKDVLTKLLVQLQAYPQTVLVDAHPNYYSALLGEELALSFQGSKVVKVPHHKAHCAAVLAENALLISGSQDAEPVLGVVWDGLGFGEDKNGDEHHKIWGGEFFLCKREAGKRGTMERIGHLKTFPYLYHNLMSYQTTLSAFALLYDEPEAQETLRLMLEKKQWRVNTNVVFDLPTLARTPKTSSVGRLFDAAAALLGLCEYNHFEGEAGMLVEAAADRFFARNGFDSLECKGLIEWQAGSGASCATFSTTPILMEILRSMQSGTSAEKMEKIELIEKLAAQFHIELVGAVQAMMSFAADKYGVKGIRKVAFSGGVFQNAVLVELLLRKQSSTFQPFFHQQLSPNDENISFGQMMYHLHFDSEIS